MSSDEIDDSFSDSNFSEGGEESYASSEESVKADSESDSPASEEEDDDDDDESAEERMASGRVKSSSVQSIQQRIFGFRYSPPDKKHPTVAATRNSRKRKEPTPDPNTYQAEWISSKKRRVEPAPAPRGNKIVARKPIELDDDSEDEVAALISPVKPIKKLAHHQDSPVKHDDSVDEEDIEALVSPVKNRTRLRRLGSLDDIAQEREDKLRQLQTMGFTDRNQASEALEHNENNVEAAVDWLLAATRKNDSEESSDEVQISASTTTRTRNGTAHAAVPRQEEKRTRDEPAPVETELEKLILKCEEYSKRLGNVMTAFMNESKDSEANNSSTQMERQPKMLQRELKDYQLIGMNWLYTLHKEGLNGILADEMGLGKTIQTISILALLKEKGIGGANLIVVPASTLSNWSNELEKWAPKLRVERYYGGQQERIGMQRRLLKKRVQKGDVSDSSIEEQSDDEDQVSPYCFDVMLTTYQTAFQKFDRAFLRKFDLSYLILDEAHNIKNKSSISFQALFKLNTQYVPRTIPLLLTPRVLTLMVTRHRLLLTGTPLQNNLDELWALLYFIMPAMFGSFRNFQLVTAQFSKKNKRSTALSETQVIQRTKKILTPFILRRLKSTVSLGLKPKIEKVIKCQLTEMQKQHYQDLYKQSRTMWQKHIEELSKKGKPHKSDESDEDSEAEKNKKKKKTVNISVLLNNILMQLRKVANHPLMLRTQYTSDKLSAMAKQLKAHEKDYRSEALPHIVEDLEAYSDFQLHELCLSHSYLKEYRLSNDLLYNSSGKLLALKKLLKDLFQAEHRVLIFSQMTKVLDILEHYVSHLDYKYLRLDGQTPVSERQEKIDQFNSDRSVFIFLLSTRAGGLGINLATADTAVFYDISFNPQVDRQAEDRCHRLGQEKQVRIFKFIAEGSIDEHMLKMAVEKKELNDVVLEEGEYDGNVRDTEADVLNDTREGVEDLFDVMFNSEPQDETKEHKSNGHEPKKNKIKQSTPNTSTASNDNNASRGSDLFTLEGSLALSDDEDVVQLNDNSDDIVVLD